MLVCGIVARAFADDVGDMREAFMLNILFIAISSETPNKIFCEVARSQQVFPEDCQRPNMAACSALDLLNAEAELWLIVEAIRLHIYIYTTSQ